MSLTRALLCLLLPIVVAVPALADGSVTFIDVGQGDAIWVHDDTGFDALVDAGDESHAGVVLSHLQHVPNLDVVVWTHAHADHIGGLCDVLSAMPVDRVLYNGFDYNSATFNDLLDLVNALGLELETVTAGDAFTWGDYSVWVLHPTREYLNTNDSSVVLRLSYGPTDILLTGDIEWEAESDLLARGANLQAEVLKVPHHGSVSSSHTVFLDAVQPEVAIISVGPNAYGHPSDIVEQRLQNRGIITYRTDVVGTVTARMDRSSYHIRTSAAVRLPLVIQTEPSVPDGARLPHLRAGAH
jgi:beta-lactamase superfamily II metal-dependent hydrolase